MSSIPALDFKILPTSEIVFEGSSKIFYSTRLPGVLRMVFKDKVHGRGRESTIEGTGQLRASFCRQFYSILEHHGIQTHLVADIESPNLKFASPSDSRGFFVRRVEMIPLELVTRFVAKGHWVDDHKIPLFNENTYFTKPFVEYCLKLKSETPNLKYRQLSEEQRSLHAAMAQDLTLKPILIEKTCSLEDPRVSPEIILEMSKSAACQRFRDKLPTTLKKIVELKRKALQVNELLASILLSEGILLEDSKLEFGYDPQTGGLLLADESTQDTCRMRAVNGDALTRDLYRGQRSPQQLVDSYSRLNEALASYARKNSHPK